MCERTFLDALPGTIFSWPRPTMSGKDQYNVLVDMDESPYTQVHQTRVGSSSFPLC